MPIPKGTPTLYDVLVDNGYRFVSRVKGFKYGVEIEVEGSDLPRELKSWRDYQDNSLRARPDRNEYISKPVTLKELDNALSEFGKACKTLNTVSLESVRTSVHVHCNVQDLSVASVASLLTTFLMFEGSLYSVCGAHREGNVFCAPLSTTYRALIDVITFLSNAQTNNPLTNEIGDSGRKYTTMNFRPMITSDHDRGYGTVEFRAHEGTISTERIRNWVGILDAMLGYASNRTPADVLNDFSGVGLEEFPTLVFGEYSPLITVDTESFWQGLDLAHTVVCACDWENPPTLSKKKPPEVTATEEDTSWDNPPPPPPRNNINSNDAIRAINIELARLDF